MANNKVYEIVNEKIMAALDANVIPWKKPWKTGIPTNLVSKKPYRGANIFILGIMPFTSPYWLTYNQAKQLGGEVKKGEKGTPVVFWKVWEKKNGEKFPVLRYYTVFNVEQCDLPEGKIPKVEELDFSPVEKAEEIVAGYKNGPKINYEGNRACYIPGKDLVMIPPKEVFVNSEKVYSTLFHELGHSTGHKTRLNRKSLVDLTSFGSHTYSEEELVAEFTASYLCAIAGIDQPTQKNSVSYIAGWKQELSDPNNVKLIVQAAAKAQKAADHILGVSFEKEKENNA